MRGRYANLSPRGRTYVTQYTPFAPWYINAVHFWAVTMPSQHPALTGALAAMYLGNEKKIKGEKLPPWDMGNIGGVNINRFTPAGIFQHGPSETPVIGAAHDLILPQVLPITLNLLGKDWTLRDLPAGSNAQVALNTAATTFLPFLSAAQRFREHGGTAQSGSTLLHPRVKPGTQLKGAGKQAEKIFLPGYPVNAPASVVGNPAHLKPSHTASKGGNRFLNGSSGGNRFLQSSSSNNRFLSGSGSSGNRFLSGG